MAAAEYETITELLKYTDIGDLIATQDLVTIFDNATVAEAVNV